MSTRCIVALTDNGIKPVLFYRHMDGYPEGVQPTLDRFCERLRNGDLRNNSTQAAGWLVLLGREEMLGDAPDNPSDGWKCGSYEPCSDQRLTTLIEYLHVVNVKDGTWHPIRMANDKAIISAANAVDHRLPEKDMEKAWKKFDQTCFNEIERVFGQLASGELASWQPEPRPAPTLNPTP